MAKYDYSTIKKLRSEIIESATTNFLRGKIKKEEWEKSFGDYEKAIGKNVDRETFLAYEYSNFDVYINVTELICTMKRCFPKTRQKWVLLKVGKFILEDSKSGFMKCPILNHVVLSESLKRKGLDTYQLLGLQLS